LQLGPQVPAPPHAGSDVTADEEPDSDPQDSSLRLVAVRPPDATDDPAMGDAERELSDQRSA